jgi:hypothetical protein
MSISKKNLPLYLFKALRKRPRRKTPTKVYIALLADKIFEGAKMSNGIDESYLANKRLLSTEM